jgi:hypothetical protein
MLNSGICRSDGAGNDFWFGFYKYGAPTALPEEDGAQLSRKSSSAENSDVVIRRCSRMLAALRAKITGVFRVLPGVGPLTGRPQATVRHPVGVMRMGMDGQGILKTRQLREPACFNANMPLCKYFLTMRWLVQECW